MLSDFDCVSIVLVLTGNIHTILNDRKKYGRMTENVQRPLFTHTLSRPRHCFQSSRRGKTETKLCHQSQTMTQSNYSPVIMSLNPSAVLECKRSGVKASPSELKLSSAASRQAVSVKSHLD